MAKNLVLTMGIPGAGKSTLLKEKCNPKTDIIVSRDKIRFNKLSEKDEYFAKENEVWKEYIATLKLFLTDDNYETVIADATHLNAQSREKILNALSDVLDGIDIYVLYVMASLETALKRNAQRKGRSLVPESAIRNMYNNLQIPDKREGFFYYGYIDSPVNILFKKGK